MGEPEDLILDGAYLASRLARDVWRRYAPPATENLLRLSDVRVRIELFLNALFEMPIAITAADPAAPVSWLARLAGRSPGQAPLPGNDGTRIYLPPTLGVERGADETLRTYLLLAVEQAVRIARASASVALGIEDGEVRDRFLLADAVAVDDWIARHAPGLVPALRAARRDDAQRRGAWPGGARERTIEERIRDVLATDPLDGRAGEPPSGSPADALAWARQTARGTDDSRRYRGIPAVWYWGSAQHTGAVAHALTWPDRDDTRPQTTNRRVVEMRRRPRIREAEEGEDDTGTGTWVVRADEPQETVEDPMGLQRPTDRANEADPEGLGDSLAELPEARIVRTPAPAKEVLRAGDDPPRTAGAMPVSTAGAGIAYPEWDFRSGAYRRPGAIVRESAPALGDARWAEAARTRHAALARRVRTRFERLRSRRSQVGRQADGPEIDVSEYVNAAADARAGVVVDDRLYVDVRPERRELTVALLVDISASTDSWVSGQQRIVDVEKDALFIVCEALGALGDPYAIFGFSGESAAHVSLIPVKRFADRTDSTLHRRIAALEADGYTRVGAAIRHTTAALVRQPTARRLLLILSDGKPNDVDDYEGPYGIEDARQAVSEARAQNVDVFCLTVDREAPRYAPRIFGRSGFGLLRRPDQLPEVLIDVLRRMIRP
jgi:nitric oxide reductase NorD protein